MGAYSWQNISSPMNIQISIFLPVDLSRSSSAHAVRLPEPQHLDHLLRT
ncbi:hypothetical protein MTYP_02637 [Methylophilaceae bacterium]|nr:hypothetical protein MTYP_02637 [Methylophilaceae bacterium]